MRRRSVLMSVSLSEATSKAFTGSRRSEGVCHNCKVTVKSVPVCVSPCLLVERAAIEIFKE